MAAAAARTSVLYFVPEDGDEEEHPNVFSIARPAGKVRLGDVKQKFPLPGGYQFRFKRAFKNTFVWADVGDDYEVVPRFEGNIVCKVTRLHASSGGAARRAGAGAGAGTVTAEVAVPVMRSASMPPSGAGALDTQPVARSPVLQPMRAQQVSTPLTSSSLFESKPSSHNDLLGLHSPSGPQMTAQAPTLAAPKLSAPPEARTAAGVSSALSAADMALGDGDMMNLDWSSSGPSPSPSPPPQTTLGAAAGARTTAAGRSSSPVKKAPLQSAAGGAASSSSIGAGKTGNNASLSVPSDLSSAAKDFKL
jgi:hypothetical protein